MPVGPRRQRREDRRGSPQALDAVPRAADHAAAVFSERSAAGDIQGRSPDRAVEHERDDGRGRRPTGHRQIGVRGEHGGALDEGKALGSGAKLYVVGRPHSGEWDRACLLLQPPSQLKAGLVGRRLGGTPVGADEKIFDAVQRFLQHDGTGAAAAAAVVGVGEEGDHIFEDLVVEARQDLAAQRCEVVEQHKRGPPIRGNLIMNKANPISK